MAQLVLPHHQKASAPTSAPEAIDQLVQTRVRFMKRQSQPTYLLQQTLKRLGDILLAGMGTLLISPVLMLISLLIWLDSRGPVFYLSERIGKNYQPFKMVKFRTMVVDADAQRDQLREEANLNGELFKIQNDPRITRLGQFLRATSLDELPQLFNVLAGHMSLVGPRPLPPDESHLFEEPYTLRYQVIPGMTGMWQVNGRSTTDFRSLCELEMKYILNWTIAQDIKLLFQTIPAVLTSRGAC